MTVLIKRFSLVLVFVVSATVLVFASTKEKGKYPIVYFSHRDYSAHSQNWAIVQDSRGLIYVANNNGILEFDGSEWRKISVNGALVRCLEVDKAGRIWVGGQGELGYLAPDSLGLMKFFSLLSTIGESCKPIGLVRQVYSTTTGVYFSTNTCIINVHEGISKVYKPETIFHRTYSVYDKLFSVQPDVGLTMAVGDSMILVADGTRFAKMRIYCMLPFDSQHILIGTQSEGFFLYKTKFLNSQVSSLKEEVIVPFITTDDNFFKSNWIYCATPLSNGTFAIGTYRGGAAILNSKGEVVRYINKEFGLKDETVWYVSTDNHDNLWFALNNGIAYTNTSAAITSWSEESGLQGVVQSSARYKEGLYVSTNSGVHVYSTDKFERIKDVKNLSWDMKQVVSTDGNLALFISTGDGVYILENKKSISFLNGSKPSFTFLESKYFKDIVYVAQYEGIGVVARKNGRWAYLGQLSSINGRVVSIAEENDGTLWFLERYKGVSKARIGSPASLFVDTLITYTDIPFNPRLDDDSEVHVINNDVKVSSNRGLSHFSKNENKFVADSSLGVEFANSSMGLRIFQIDSNGYLWYEAYKEEYSRWIERAILQNDGTFSRLTGEFNAIPRMIFYGLQVEPNGVAWFSGSDALYRYDPEEESKATRLPRVLIREVTLSNGSIIFNGAFKYKCADGNYGCTGFSQQESDIPVIDYSNNSFSFSYSTPFFDQVNKAKYSVFLEGFDKQWSDWSPINHKEYTNLPHGKYTFNVKTLNVYDVESAVATYSFVIQRPWFYYPITYILYFILFIAIVVFSVWVKTRMLKHSNIKLQLLVNDRTKEIMKQQVEIMEKNEELSQQKEELQAQRDDLINRNKNINSSLQYAVTIQQSILPEKKFLNHLFENFVIYLPKDVVSGDFYWVSHWPAKGKSFEKVFVALVDCTGHGVPGAFMSMIGSRLLSEIVNERKIHSPELILAELDIAVNTVLHQQSTDNFDGMDVALCCLTYKRKGEIDITYAGANRPMYFHKKNSTKMEIVKGNRRSIGGMMPELDMLFENKYLTLESGDSIFLYTDGMPDQNNFMSKKFTSCRLNTLILSSINKPMDSIGSFLVNEFNGFKDGATQRDDITVIGIRLPNINNPIE